MQKSYTKLTNNIKKPAYKREKVMFNTFEHEKKS